MKTTLYLIRHGESEGNLRAAFLGHTDLPLTEKGRAQARKTAAFLAEKKPDVIYASDLMRAYQTAEATAERFGMPIVKEQGLREIFAGEWEDLLFDDIGASYAEDWRVWCEDIGNACPTKGESTVELQKRVVDTITRIVKENEGKTLFFFSHATPIRVFSSYVMGKTTDEIKDLPWAPNASVTEVTFDGEAFSMVEYGRDDFMGEMSTRLPDNV